jgi:hypothetical protein
MENQDVLAYRTASCGSADTPAPDDEPCSSVEKWLLAPEVYVCATEECPATLLDLKANRYWTFTPQQRRILAANVRGWPAPDCRSGHRFATTALEFDEPMADRFLHGLVDRGLLSCDARLGKEARPIQLPTPSTALVEPELDTFPKVTLGNGVNFLWAMTRARQMLRRQSLLSIVESIRQMKRARSIDVGDRDIDLDGARVLVAAFDWLRPLLFSGPRECMLDVLGLLLYLSRYGLFPSWVIGVRMRPFESHTWSQDGSTTWSDTPARASSYTPIFVV